MKNLGEARIATALGVGESTGRETGRTAPRAGAGSSQGSSAPAKAPVRWRLDTYGIKNEQNFPHSPLPEEARLTHRTAPVKHVLFKNSQETFKTNLKLKHKLQVTSSRTETCIKERGLEIWT